MADPILLASADRAPGTYTAEFSVGRGFSGILIGINYTAEGGGSSTLDAKVQYWDPAEQAWDDLPTASINQMGAVGEGSLTIGPNYTPAAGPPDKIVAIGLPDGRLRLSATVAVTNVTFSAHLARLR